MQLPTARRPLALVLAASVLASCSPTPAPSAACDCSAAPSASPAAGEAPTSSAATTASTAEEAPLVAPASAIASDPEDGQRLAGAVLPGAADVALYSSQARIALQVTEDLFAGRYEAIRARLIPSLREELSAARVEALAEGVMQVHGRPARVLDAWRTTAKEEDVNLDAGAVLMRMARTNTRFRLLIVFDRGGISGLWFRPI